MSLKNPQKKYRALPFWSWNGKLDKKELERQVEILEKMGFGGAFMHSRCGLSTEYMSKEWLFHVENTANYFTSKNMQGWLYDEDRWPSGSCGGLATKKMENRQKALSMYFENDGTMYEDKQILCTFAVKLTGEADNGKIRLGKSLANYKKISENDSIPDDYEKAIFVAEFIQPSDFYNGNTYLDTLNKEAVKDFILLTHEKYKAAYGNKFGKEIKGIFTDEPHRGGVFNGFNITNKNAQAMLPWSYDTFALYAEKYGERIEEKLPELFFRKEGEDFNCTVWRYLEILQQQFLDAFAIPYYEWCKKNHLLVTGHVWDENTLLGQINWQGSVMRYYKYMDIPGIDNLRDDNYFFAAPLQAVSVAKQMGKKEILSEMYACTGWKTTFDYYKRSGDWQAILGINVRCPHLSWYTMGGEAKRDCPASISFQAGWYKEYKYVEDYFARLKMTFGEAEYLTDTLLLSPIESAWGLVRAGGYSSAERFRKLESDWRNIVDTMLFGGVDFDIADEDILLRKAYIAVGNGEPTLAIGKMRYKTVVLPPLVNIRLSSLRVLRAFAAHGGNIVIADNLPAYIDGKRKTFDIKAKIVSLTEVPNVVKTLSQEKYSIDFQGKMLSKIKQSGQEYMLFAVAFDCEGVQEAKITIDGTHTLSKINLRTGEREALHFIYKDNKTIIQKNFVKGEELLLSIDGIKPAEEKRWQEDRQIVNISQTQFDYLLNEPNILPLDFAEYTIDGEGQGNDEFLKIDKAIRGKFGLKERSANNLQPWFEEKYDGGNYHKKLCRVQLKYTFNADMVPANAYLMLENLPNAKWCFNGKILKESTKKPFIEDICFSRYDLDKDDFIIGENEIEVTFDFTPACNLETVYLVGDFAVQNRTLCKKPEKITFGDICGQGFPHYTGAITYQIPLANGIYDVEELQFNAACIKLGDKIAAFAPFALRNIEVTKGILPLTAVLLRRNLFGPLHEIPKNHGNYWSGSYRTDGEKFTDEYQLNEQGIFSMPKIYQKEERMK